LTGAALYERQRVLTTLGVLEATPGRGPGSGVPLTAENFATVLISVLATDNLSDVDEKVATLCNARPADAHPDLHDWRARGKPTFKTEVARILSGQKLAWPEVDRVVSAVRVVRPGRGEIDCGLPVAPFPPIQFFGAAGLSGPIQISAELNFMVLGKLQEITCFTLAAAEEEGDE